jgi:hypothetical protein
MHADGSECPGRAGGMMRRVAQIAWPKAKPSLPMNPRMIGKYPAILSHQSKIT